jgi:hypothetical protein
MAAPAPGLVPCEVFLPSPSFQTIPQKNKQRGLALSFPSRPGSRKNAGHTAADRPRARHLVDVRHAASARLLAHFTGLGRDDFQIQLVGMLPGFPIRLCLFRFCHPFSPLRPWIGLLYEGEQPCSLGKDTKRRDPPEIGPGAEKMRHGFGSPGAE